MEFSRTKIVATIGPSTASKEVLMQIIDAGVNVCRLNFSHGSHDEYKEVVRQIREINEEYDKNVAILADLQGPKIRIGEVEGEGVELHRDDRVDFISNGKFIGSKEKLCVNYEELATDLKEGEQILVDDGKFVFDVVGVKPAENTVQTKVVNGGLLTSKKGVNLPNSVLSLPSMTKKDLADLVFALEQKIEWIALSFVRSARDIIELKHLIDEKNGNSRVIAKIEKPEAIRYIEDILNEADGLMVARGDLGVEMPMEEVPILQKKLVRRSLRAGKPIIVATQMMESMINHYRPTRAEVNDVANAVMDGADAVMLSAETSVGKYPVQVVENMTKIIREVEKSGEDYNYEFPPKGDEDRFITDSICYSASRLAQRVDAKGIVTMTHSGYTAFKISSFRPEAVIFVFSSNREILNMLSLVWGVKAFYYDKFVSTDHTIADIKFILKNGGFVKTNDLIINVASMPIKDKGQVNMLKLSQID
jgi:pyruvate kinase